MKSFVDALDRLVTERKAQMKLKLLKIETSVKSELSQNFSTLNQRHCNMEPVLEFFKMSVRKKKNSKLCRQGFYE